MVASFVFILFSHVFISYLRRREIRLDIYLQGGFVYRSLAKPPRLSIHLSIHQIPQRVNRDAGDGHLLSTWHEAKNQTVASRSEMIWHRLRQSWPNFSKLSLLCLVYKTWSKYNNNSHIPASQSSIISIFFLVFGESKMSDFGLDRTRHHLWLWETLMGISHYFLIFYGLNIESDLSRR